MNIFKTLLYLAAVAVVIPISLHAKNSTCKAADKPIVVGVPPADGGRGLVRISTREIRHYSGNKRKKLYLVSKDNGETWKEEIANDDYPKNYGGASKESASIVQNPNTKEFLRVQKTGGVIFISKGGIDGKWGAVTTEGKLDFDWKKTLNKDPKSKKYKALKGLKRPPTFVNNGKRILIPAHGGSTFFHISDDQGLTWTRSKNSIRSPKHEPNEIDKGYRWQNNGVEGTILELKDKRLWVLLRTSQDEYYESFSKDWGITWSKPQPSCFFGTLTMPTLHRLEDGRILASWTNTKALPESIRTLKSRGGEDAFTNRDSHHLAISEDDGKTWIGFREVILDEIRNREDYATYLGSGDKGKHQGEIVQIGKNKVLMSLGQNRAHRRLMIVDLNYLYEKNRSSNFKQGLEDWTVHTYKPYKRGHCAYHRKASSSIITDSGSKYLQIHRVSDPELINTKDKINYEKGGATWNFPNGQKGELTIKFTLDKDSQGTQISLTDRLFNACDETTKKFAVFSIKLQQGEKLGAIRLEAKKEYKLKFTWNGVTEDSKCDLYLNGQKVKTIKCLKPSPNGLSYIHFISTAKTVDKGLYLKSVKASIK